MENNFKKVAGSVCIFGDWFGKPMDNYHQVISFEEKGNHIKLVFNEGESLDIWDGKEIEINQSKLTIMKASRIRWEWFYYGKPKIIENRFFIDHIVKNNEVIATSNVNWYTPDFNSSMKVPAVRIL